MKDLIGKIIVKKDVKNQKLKKKLKNIKKNIIKKTGENKIAFSLNQWKGYLIKIYEGVKKLKRCNPTDLSNETGFSRATCLIYLKILEELEILKLDEEHYKKYDRRYYNFIQSVEEENNQ